MERPSFLFSTADLIILFLYGLLLCYFDNYLMPMSAITQLLISFITALFLGSMGPGLDEVVEWIIFFTLGILVVFLYPTAHHAFTTQSLALHDVLVAAKAAGLYSSRLLIVWVAGIPLGQFFHSVTDTKYYRHNSF